MTLWEIIWIVAMLGLVISVAVAAFREKSAEAKARKDLVAKNQAMDQQLDEGFGDGFNEPQPDDSFGNDDFASFDDKAFR